MKKDIKINFSDALSFLKKAQESLSDNDIRLILSGDAHISAQYIAKRKEREKGGENKSYFTSKGGKDILKNKKTNVMDSKKHDDIKGQLYTSDSRGYSTEILKKHFPKKGELFQFAQYLSVAVQKKDSSENIRERIVAMTTGAKLESRAIREWRNSS